MAYSAEMNDRLFEALLQLKSEAIDYSEITVSQLTQTAGISRQTFYRHYKSIDDVIYQRLHEFKLATLKDFSKIQMTPDIMITTLLAYWQQHQDFFALIRWANQLPMMIENISFLNQKIMTMNNVVHIDDTYIVNSYAGSIVMFLQTFTQDGRPAKQLPTLVALFKELNGSLELLFR